MLSVMGAFAEFERASAADVIGLFSLNVVSFSNNVVSSAQIFSINVVPKPPM
jgi:hypothetical protein